jgi:hypothetical protein
MVTYDDFSSDAPSPEFWQVAGVPLGDGAFWMYQDANARVSCSDNRCTISIQQFSRHHDTVQIFDNPKQLYLSTHAWATGGGPLTFATTMAANCTGDAADYRDGFASVNVLDFASGMVFDIASSGRRLWAIYERLLIPGVTTEDEAFTEVVDLQVDTAPDREHEVAVIVDSAAGRVDYLVDGEPRLTRENLPATPESLVAGFGLITLHPIENGRSVSCRGQGGEGRWGPFTVSAPGQPLKV